MNRASTGFQFIMTLQKVRPEFSVPQQEQKMGHLRNSWWAHRINVLVSNLRIVMIRNVFSCSYFKYKVVNIISLSLKKYTNFKFMY